MALASVAAAPNQDALKVTASARRQLFAKRVAILEARLAIVRETIAANVTKLKAEAASRPKTPSSRPKRCLTSRRSPRTVW
jgi:hypothetical protein